VDILYPIYPYATKEDVVGLAIGSYETPEVTTNTTNVHLRLYVLIDLESIVVREPQALIFFYLNKLKT